MLRVNLSIAFILALKMHCASKALDRTAFSNCYQVSLTETIAIITIQILPVIHFIQTFLDCWLSLCTATYDESHCFQPRANENSQRTDEKLQCTDDILHSTYIHLLQLLLCKLQIIIPSPYIPPRPLNLGLIQWPPPPSPLLNCCPKLWIVAQNYPLLPISFHCC